MLSFTSCFHLDYDLKTVTIKLSVARSNLSNTAVKCCLNPSESQSGAVQCLSVVAAMDSLVLSAC